MHAPDAGTCAREASTLAAEGRDGEAAAMFDAGLARFPDDARFANSAGNFHARAGRNDRALALFERALQIDSAFAEAALNCGIVLLRLQRPRAAEAALTAHEKALAGRAQYWSLRADCAKARGDHAQAATLLDRAAAIEPGGAGVLRRRARLALERGEAAAVGAHEAALEREPGNFDVMDGYALALQAAGRQDEALDFASALAAHFPSWTRGQSLLAELRWAAGQTTEFADNFAAATEAHPAADTFLEWAGLLSGVDRHHEAAAVLDRARVLWPGDIRVLTASAVALGETGDAAKADALLVNLADTQAPDLDLARARNDMRLARYDAAEARLGRLVAQDSGNIAAWALLDLCWRLAGNSQHEWLHGPPGLVREIELPLGAAELAAIVETLQGLHRSASIPIAQSVKGGTQTAGALFARPGPDIAALQRAIEAVLKDYRAGLPAADPRHPLLAHRDAPWLIAGSWSVRFSGSGRHAAHIHPRGIVSSACYFIVPEQVDGDERPGWLELGRPPAGLADALEPLIAVKPSPGKAVLFPSTLHHGTRPLAGGERMTVAFDVASDTD